MLNYKKLFIKMSEKGISQYNLIEKQGFSAETITRLRNNYFVNGATLNKLCKILDCKIEEIVTYEPDNEETEK